jgi:hypothetical protein
VWVFRIENATGQIIVDDDFTCSAGSFMALSALDAPVDGDVLAISSHDTGFAAGQTCTGDTITFDIQEVVLDSADYTDTEVKAFRKAAVEQARALILPVPGTEEIPGGFRLKGKNYVFRDGILYRGIANDWEICEFPEVLYFDEGIYEFEVGDVITDGTRTATVASITRQTGAWNYTLAAVDQSAGYITTTDASGAFAVDAELTVVPAAIPALLNGNFATDTIWTKGTGWTIATDKADSDGTQTANSNLTQPFVYNGHVTITYTVSSRTGGTVKPLFGTVEGTAVSADGTYTETLTADATVIGFVADLDFVGKIDDVTVVYSPFPAFKVGDFASDTIWVKETGWTIAAGKADCSGAQTADSRLYQPFVVDEDEAVKITFTVSSYSAGKVAPLLGLAEGTDVIANGTYTQTLTATAGTDKIGFIADADFIGKIDDVTIAVGRRAKVKTTNTEYTLPVGGNIKAEVYNFTNLANNESAYGVSGVAEAFEFDGVNYIPIFHPDAPTTWPYDVLIHQERLQLFFPGGQFSNSIAGGPRIFNTLLGAITYSTGAEITGVKKIHDNAEAVFCNSSVWLLLGTGVYDPGTATRDWVFGQHDSTIGAIDGSVAKNGPPIFVGGDELRRIFSTDTTDKYASEPIMEKMQPFLKTQISKISQALWSRSKSQLRLFFDDNKAFFYTFEKGQEKGGTLVTYTIPVKHAWSEYEGSVEHMFFTSTTGYLYRMDSGNSFDGDFIDGYFRLPFYNYGSPRTEKRFITVVIDFEAPVILTNETTMSLTVDHAYGSILYPAPVFIEIEGIGGRGGVYGDNPGWGLVSWSGDTVTQITAEPDGYGANMSIFLTFSTRGDDSFTFLSVTSDYQELGTACLG